MDRLGYGDQQTTLRQDLYLEGVGVHSGAPASIGVTAADADTGLRFQLSAGPGDVIDVPAHYTSVCGVTLCTTLGDGCGAYVATVEHLMAALRALRIDNAIIEIDGSEVPVMDGSAMPFVDAINEAGVRVLSAPRRYIKVLKPVRVDEGDSFAELRPYDGFHVDVEIAFDTPVIGEGRISLDVEPDSFCTELARARTFGFMKDVERLWASGRALGASLENTVAVADDRVINPEGLRFEDEFVRHKALDAVGDLSLAGAPLLARFRSRKGGHRMNYMVLKELFADEGAWAMVQRAPSREVLHSTAELRAAIN